MPESTVRSRLFLYAFNTHPEYSGGAIFHTGFLRVRDTNFPANEAGAEGTAVFSIGLLDELFSVSFSRNTYYCPVGKYGYIVETDVRHINIPGNDTINSHRQIAATVVKLVFLFCIHCAQLQFSLSVCHRWLVAWYSPMLKLAVNMVSVVS